MKPALKLNVFFAHFPYGGNGGVATEIPQIRKWEVMTALKMRDDPRIGEFYIEDFSDTPVTLTRNTALMEARKRGSHLALMIDSDNNPMRHYGEPGHKPFWDEAFNFIYDNYHKGPRLVFAPYCGPPGCGENVYCFHWADSGSGRGEETHFKLDAYTRHQASMMTGIQECAAGPTGMMLLDLRVLDLIEPSKFSKREVLERIYSHQMTPQEGLRALREGFFYYEWENQYASKKASTEDVTFTRDISLAGISEYGYNPVFCAWDSWVGHQKPWDVGRPERYTAEQVNASLVSAALRNERNNEITVDLANHIDSELTKLVEQALANDPLPGEVKSNGNGHSNLKFITPPAPKETPCHKVSAAPIIYGDMRTADTQGGLWFEHGHAPVKHREALQDLVKSHAYSKQRPLRILEVGSWLGSTAMAMADSITNGCVHCVDTWNGTPSDITGELAREAKESGGDDVIFEAFKRNIGDRLNKTIIPWRMTSAEAAAMHWEPFDLIFIDAEHTYEGCKADIAQWWKHLRHDGVMCGHDFETHQCPGVTKAVYEAFGEKTEAFGWHPQGCLWKVIKSECPNLYKQPESPITTHHWNAWRETLKLSHHLSMHDSETPFVVEIGPGNNPLSYASEYVGRKHPASDYHGRTFYDLDLNRDRLPYDDQSVDFVYCRHVLEDLENPMHLLSEIKRVAKAGWIETPSPICECTHDVDAPGAKHTGKGYTHHRNILWSDGETLHVLPKFPILNELPITEHPELLNEGAWYWNTYHHFTSPLAFRHYEHTVDFNVTADERYEKLIWQACREGIETSLRVKRQAESVEVSHAHAAAN